MAIRALGIQEIVSIHEKQIDKAFTALADTLQKAGAGDPVDELELIYFTGKVTDTNVSIRWKR